MLGKFLSLFLFVLADERGELDLTALSSELKAFTGEAKATLQKILDDDNETRNRLLCIEQKMVAPRGGFAGGDFGSESLGALVTQSEGFKAMLERGAKSTGTIPVRSFHTKTAVVNATGSGQPLVAADRLSGIITTAQPRLTIRDLLPSGRTNSNLVEFAKELAVTNNAGPQTGGSPNSGENVSKPESAITYELDSAKVETIAHWIPASRQVVSDSQSFANYINGRMLYLLKSEEENELLNGSGSGNHLNGLITQADTFDTAYSNATDTYIDVLRKAIGQVYRVSRFAASGIGVNVDDWQTIQLIKETGSGISSGQYIFSSPQAAGVPQLWGLPVVETHAMAAGQFLVGAFNVGAQIWDREDATVEVSREHASFFIQNMVAVLCEERLALSVYRPSAFVYGGFPYGS